MAYALRLQIEYKDINDIDTRIEIHQEDYQGAPVYREYASGDVACEIVCGDSSGKRLPVVYGSQVTLFFDAETELEFLDFFTSNSRKNKILVYKNNSLAAVTFGEPDTWSEPLEAAPYEVSFTGYDGLGLLADEDFLQEDKSEYTGQLTPLEILTLVLGKTGFSLPINTAVGFRPAGTVGDPLTVVTKNVVTYREMSCLDVLEKLFQGCRIFQRAGQWWVISNEKWNDPSVTCYHYTAAGVPEGTVLIDTEFSGFWFEGSGNREFMPALKQLKVIQDFGYKPNLLKNYDFSKINDQGNFDNWTAVGTTPEQRAYDADGNKFVYLPGTERLDPWDTANRTKYIVSDPITVTQASDIFNLKISYALMGPAGSSSYIFFGLFLEGDDGKDYSLTPYLWFEIHKPREIRYKWVESPHKLACPVKANNNPKYSRYPLPEPERVVAYPYNEVMNHFTDATIVCEGGIPTTGKIRMYLFLAHTGSVVAGSCFREIKMFITDEDEQEFPTETEFLIVNDRRNNYVPDDIELANGDLPLIPNRLTVYDGGFVYASSGEPTELWSLDGVAGSYPYAELVSRLVAAEMQYARESYQVRLADAIPQTALVIEDNNKRFIEAGITYNDRMQAIEGRYVELPALNINAFTVAEKTLYAERQASGGSSGGGSGATFAPDEKVKLIDPVTFDLEGQPGYLSAEDFEHVVDEATGRAVITVRLPRANTQALDTGNNTVEFLTPFPPGEQYVLWSYTHDANSFQVAHKVLSQDESGFVIYVPRACSLIYTATPKK